METRKFRIVAAFLAAVMCLGVAGAMLFRSLNNLNPTIRSVNHARDVQASIREVVMRLSDGENARRGFVLSGQTRYLNHFTNAVLRVNTALSRLSHLVLDNPTQTARVEKLKPMVKARVELHQTSLRERMQGLNLESQLSLTEKGQAVMEPIRQLADEMAVEEASLLETRELLSQRAVHRTQFLSILVFALSLGILSWAFLLFNRENDQRKTAQLALREANRVLEDRVGERTAELGKMVERLRETQAFTDKVMEMGLVGIGVLDTAGRLTMANKALANCIGVDQTTLVGQSVESLLQPPDAARFQTLFQCAIQGQPTPGDELQMLTPRGTRLSVMLALSPLAGRGEGGAVVINMLDITNLKQAQEDLRELNGQLETKVLERTAQLQAVNEELESFSYSISHDLRAPLRHIEGFMEMLGQDETSNLSADGRRYLQVVSRASVRMSGLIDDLLNFSRMGRTSLSRTTVKFSNLVEDVRAEVALAARDRSIEWEIGKLPEVTGDVAMLRQVWLNLLGNAVKYTKNQPHARIRIAATMADREWTFSVSDNGAGFDMRYMDRLFGVFQRLHPPEEFEGTGIGLAHVRRIINRHGGRTWAEGQVGNGATFYFSLPVHS